MKRLLLFIMSLALLALPSLYGGQVEPMTMNSLAVLAEGSSISAVATTSSYSEALSGDNVNVVESLEQINAPTKYTITPVAKPNGRIVTSYIDEDGYSVTSDISKPILEGTEVTMVASPETDYVTKAWYYNGQQVTASAENPNEYKFTVSEDAEIYAVFGTNAPMKYTITPVTKPNGRIATSYIDEDGYSVTSEISKPILEGTEVTMVASPETDYVTKAWYYNGQQVTASAENPNEYKFTVSEDAEIYAVFGTNAPMKYTITPVAKPNGRIATSYIDEDGYSVTSEISKPILEGTEVTMVASPETDYVTKAWYYNGQQVTASAENPNKYKFTVSEDAEIYAVFGTQTPNMVPLTFTVSAGGAISARYMQDGSEYFPESGDNVPSGIDVTFSVQLQDGYQVSQWVINDQEQPSLASMTEITYTVNKATTVAAVLEQDQAPKSYQITPLQRPNGGVVTTYVDEEGYSVTSEIPKQILAGTEVTMVALPELDYVTEAWYYNGQQVAASADNPNKYKFVVSEDAEIYAVFKAGESGYVVSFEAEEHGQFITSEAYTPAGILSFTSGDKVPVGSRIVLTVSPDNGYKVDQWYVNGTAQPNFEGKAGYSGDVNEDMNIRVTFKSDGSAPEDYEIHFSSSDDQLGSVRAVYVDTETAIEDGAKVSKGSKIRFEAVSKKPETYVVDKWLLNGNTMADSKGLLTHTVTVDAPISVRVVFRDATSVELIETGDIQVYIVGEQLFVRGAMSPVEVALYTAEGYLIFVRDVVEMTDVSTLAQGVYFVSIAGKSYRVLK